MDRQIHRLIVSKADVLLNTVAYQRWKQGDPRYVAGKGVTDGEKKKSSKR